MKEVKISDNRTILLPSFPKIDDFKALDHSDLLLYTGKANPQERELIDKVIAEVIADDPQAFDRNPQKSKVVFAVVASDDSGKNYLQKDRQGVKGYRLFSSRFEVEDQIKEYSNRLSGRIEVKNDDQIYDRTDLGEQWQELIETIRSGVEVTAFDRAKIVFYSDYIGAKGDFKALIKEYQDRHDADPFETSRQDIKELLTVAMVAQNMVKYLPPENLDKKIGLSVVTLPSTDKLLDFNTTLRYQTQAVKKSLVDMGYDVYGLHADLSASQLYHDLVDKPFLPRQVNSFITEDEQGNKEFESALKSALEDYQFAGMASGEHEPEVVPSIEMMNGEERTFQTIYHYPSIAGKAFNNELQNHELVNHYLAQKGISGIVRGAEESAEYIAFNKDSLTIEKVNFDNDNTQAVR